jgi:GNAT superfamily N-acetyltransferase
VIDLLFLAVHPDYTGLGLSKLLTKKALERVRQTSYEYAVMECTGYFSQRTANNCGFTKVLSIPYSDVLVDGQAVFANCPAPHTKWEFYELSLKPSSTSDTVNA